MKTANQSRWTLTPFVLFVSLVAALAFSFEASAAETRSWKFSGTSERPDQAIPTTSRRSGGRCTSERMTE